MEKLHCLIMKVMAKLKRLAKFYLFFESNLLIFKYFEFFLKIIEPNNMPTTINYFINETGICTEMNKANLYTETWITNGTSTRIYKSMCCL